MAVTEPKILIGIPIPDCDFGLPQADGLSQGWTGGVFMTGHTYGAHPDVDACKQGTGRSQIIEMAAGMTGGGGATIDSPATPPGMVPLHPGSATRAVYFYASHQWTDANAGQTVKWEVRQFNAADVFLRADDLGTISATTLGTPFQLTEFEKLLLIDTDCDHFRFRAYFNANGVADSRYYVDQIGFGWRPTVFESQPTWKNFEYYHRSAAQSVADVTSFVDRAINSEGGRKVVTWKLRLEFLSQDGAEALRFYWEAQKGTPTGNDAPAPDVAPGGLRGHTWPLLILPNRTGLKQVFYCRIFPMNEDPFRTMTGLYRFLKDPLRWEADLVLQEVLFS